MSWTPAPLSSPAEDLRKAIALEAEAVYQPTDPLGAWFMDLLLERIERRERYRRHHPRPLPIDGREYARRRRRR